MNSRQESVVSQSVSMGVGAGDSSSVTEARNALNIITAFVIAGIPSIGIFLYFGITTHSWQVSAIALIILIVSVIALFTRGLVHSGRYVQAMTIVTINVTITFLCIPFLVQGLGLISAFSVLLFIVAITSLAMPSRYIFPGLTLGFLAALTTFILDASLRYNRLTAPPQLVSSTPFVSIGLMIFFILLMARQFNKYPLRVKIVLGIMATGGIIIAALTWFGITEANDLTGLLTNQYEKEARARINENLIANVSTNAETTDGVFKGIQNDLISVAAVRANFEKENVLFNQGIYWDANTRVFQLSGGQYGNAATDPFSIFIPSTITIDQALLSDLNTTAYLSPYAPAFLSAHPEVAALYFINSAGATTYYPNINLAQNVAPNFDPRQQKFYTIADPQNDPSRDPKWTDVYKDPGGQGLIVTLAIPVYRNTTFLGVMGADVQLAKISDAVSKIKVGTTGYAFLVDGAGHIIAMPNQGYQLYGIQPETIQENESPRLSILVKGAADLQDATTKMINGETNLSTIQVNNQNTLIAFSPLKTTNYRLAIVAPESEFTADISKTKSDTAYEVSLIGRNSAIILVLLFLVSLLVSLWIGQLITTPLLRLTQTVDTISSGDLSARASVTTQDETGRLATAFNTMAERLNNTLTGLEERIAERTTALEQANTSNERRATQFESIARVAQIIGSTESGEDLLPRVVEVISQQFNFYHVGIYLLDLRKEYAVLTAASSDGGKKLLARNHRLPIDESSIVGSAIKSGQPRLALDTKTDAAYSTNPDLSHTRSEIALPLVVGVEMIGVLDVQSQEKDAFSREDINIMNTLARQVGIAIQNTRSFQLTREALKRAEIASTELSRQNWKQFTAQKQIETVVFDGVNTRTVPRNGEQPQHNLAIPLVLRGTKIGSIKLNSIDPQRVWTEDEIALLQAAADRTTLAIESARLLQEAQKRAAKERTIGDISSKISGLVNLDNILETAIKELGTNLPNTDISIQFSQEDSEQNI